jgi:hypothetical protein
VFESYVVWLVRLAFVHVLLLLVVPLALRHRLLVACALSVVGLSVVGLVALMPMMTKVVLPLPVGVAYVVLFARLCIPLMVVCPIGVVQIDLLLVAVVVVAVGTGFARCADRVSSAMCHMCPLGIVEHQSPAVRVDR